MPLPDNDRCCCWPVGEGWCNAPVAGRQPYCAHHQQASHAQQAEPGELERGVVVTPSPRLNGTLWMRRSR
jgi:hypothetical protein